MARKNQDSDLSNIVREGQEFILRNLGFNGKDIRLLGRIARMGEDKRVESLTLDEYDVEGVYDFWIYLSRDLTKEELIQFIDKYFPNRLYYKRSLEEVEAGTAYLNFRTQNSEYRLSFFEIKDEEG